MLIRDTGLIYPIVMYLPPVPVLQRKTQGKSPLLLRGRMVCSHGLGAAWGIMMPGTPLRTDPTRH